MSHRILVFYGSYRSDRMGIRLAEFVVERFRRRGESVELIDAKASEPATKAKKPICGAKPPRRAVAICSGMTMAASVSPANRSRLR